MDDFADYDEEDGTEVDILYSKLLYILFHHIIF